MALKMTKDEKNSLAYQEALDDEEPSMIDDEYYLSCYRGWRNLAQHPDDQYEAN